MKLWTVRAVKRPKAEGDQRSTARSIGPRLLTTAAWLALVAVLASCSHLAPFQRGGTAPTTHRDVMYRLLLVGDAGHSSPDSAVLSAVRTRATVAPQLTTVVYLGDNIYPAGLPRLDAPDRQLGELHLASQIRAVLDTGAEGIFVPGNHDWDNSGADGWQAVQRQQGFIDASSDGRLRLLPTAGSPGPVCEDKRGARLVFLDTQWWLHTGDRPQVDEQAVIDALQKCLKAPAALPVVVLAHHPLQTHGPHGGMATAQDHLFPLTRLNAWLWVPLPVLGSAYVFARQAGISAQDLSSAPNQHMTAAFEGVLQRAKPLVFAAGHEHNLQVLRGTRGSSYMLVSGAGSGTSPVGDAGDTLFAQQALGFMELEFTQAGHVLLTVHSEQSSGKIEPQWRMVLK